MFGPPVIELLDGRFESLDLLPDPDPDPLPPAG